MQTKPESELSPRSKHRAQEPGRGHRAVKEEKTPRQEEEGKDCDRKDTQRYRISGGGKGPRGGGDEPKAESVVTPVFHSQTRCIQALESEGQLAETEENYCAQT